MKKPNYKFKFFIDRGGTFTDVFCQYDDGIETKSLILKLLSEDPINYLSAPKEAIRRIINQVLEEDRYPSSDMKLDSETEDFTIETIRMGTTVATNALLERKGEDFALVINKGFADLLEIGYQDRPSIFDLDIKKPKALYKEVLEIDHRLVFDNGNLNLEQALDEASLIKDLKLLLDKGINNLAIVLIYSYLDPSYEKRIQDLAYKLGFHHVSISSELTPMIKLVARGETTLIDAYLSPIIKKYIDDFKSGFNSQLKNTKLYFMKSSAGLVSAKRFRGYNSILSGPAGGVVGYSSFYQDQSPSQCNPLIGFDMGGTSTDVSRFDGEFELSYESEISGLRILAPQLDIKTVAAGGGSRLFFENGMLKVGPLSAGSDPGPLCYRKNGYITITDANLVLGKLVPSFFPKVFGPNADLELDYEASYQGFSQLLDEVNAYQSKNSLREFDLEELAEAFVNLANEEMARPIREISIMRGFDIKNSTLACFGGAGGQHACALARILGMKKILIHRYSGILSAYGIALADELEEIHKPIGKEYSDDLLSDLDRQFEALMPKIDLGRQTLVKKYLNLRYEGTNTSFMIQEPINKDYAAEFHKIYFREFGFDLDNKRIIVDDIRLSIEYKTELNIANSVEDNLQELRPVTSHRVYYKSQFLECPVYDFLDISLEDKLTGPALIIQDTATIFLDPDSCARLNVHGHLELSLDYSSQLSNLMQDNETLQVSILANRFMSIAEQMGKTLEKTAISTNIKERRDFSCAIFDEEANLVANAPHQPVHLGSMGYAVKAQLKNLKNGVCILSNHPSMGGSHLPDLTVISPVFLNPDQKKPSFFVANRGHHADIGGISPGSMPSFSSCLDEEGIAIKSFNLVENFQFQEEELRKLFIDSRKLEDNVSDLKAQVAANNKGIELLKELVKSYSLDIVLSNMKKIQELSELSVREVLKASMVESQQVLQACDYLDDGSIIKLKITIDREEGSAVFDFTGSSGQLKSNLNTPHAVTSSAILYCMRAMINKEIPLNQGCLKPIKIIIPQNSLLNPSPEAAVVGGNVQTSQRIVDVIFRAFNYVAASQGCMNNISFGCNSFGYYETVGGGAGAGKDFHGASGVHTHMTNTRITDPEILETRYPVILREFSLRRGSGGKGRFNGGNGLQRALEFRATLNLSILSERRVYAPYGLEGGSAGAKGENLLIKSTGEIISLDSKVDLQVVPGDVLLIKTPGAGAYGSRS
jgi:5-oxoprolinase (ATP-hydrolysing)